MAHIKVHVWHDAGGQIIAVGRSRLGEGSGRHAVPIAGPNQSVLEVEISEEHFKDLHHTHIVDVKEKSLKLHRV